MIGHIIAQIVIGDRGLGASKLYVIDMVSKMGWFVDLVTLEALASSCYAPEIYYMMLRPKWARMFNYPTITYGEWQDRKGELRR